MAIVTLDNTFIKVDSRFRQWGKVIRSRQDVDLTKRGGYCLPGPFINWGKSVALAPGEFLLLASVTGSRANNDYSYVLLRIGDDDQPQQVALDTIRTTIAASTHKDAIKAECANSVLYSYAAYALLLLPVERPKPESAPTPVAAPTPEALAPDLDGLTPNERAIVDDIKRIDAAIRALRLDQRVLVMLAVQKAGITFTASDCRPEPASTESEPMATEPAATMRFQRQRRTL